MFTYIPVTLTGEKAASESTFEKSNTCEASITRLYFLLWKCFSQTRPSDSDIRHSVDPGRLEDNGSGSSDAEEATFWKPRLRQKLGLNWGWERLWTRARNLHHFELSIEPARDWDWNIHVRILLAYRLQIIILAIKYYNCWSLVVLSSLTHWCRPGSSFEFRWSILLLLLLLLQILYMHSKISQGMVIAWRVYNVHILKTIIAEHIINHIIILSSLSQQ